MRLGDLIRSLEKADELDTTYKIRACLAMSYPRREATLKIPPFPTSPMPSWLDDETFEAGLRASGLLAIVEHLYPAEISQAQ
jgi:hypothetical protein